MKRKVATLAFLSVLIAGTLSAGTVEPGQATERMEQGMISVLRDTSLALRVDGTREVIFRVEPGITRKVGHVAVGSVVKVYFYRNAKGQRMVTRVEAVS